jgi:hypothetical protein
MLARQDNARWSKTMAEIVNLRRARKSKVRGERDRDAAANRALHGTPAHLRKAQKASVEKQTREHALHRIDRDDKH